MFAGEWRAIHTHTQPNRHATGGQVSGAGTLRYALEVPAYAPLGGVFVAEPVILPREIRLARAQNAMPLIRANEEEFQAILQELELEDADDLTDEQRLLVFDEKKRDPDRQ